jgi:Flp pilus assembly pilin Flp
MVYILDHLRRAMRQPICSVPGVQGDCLLGNAWQEKFCSQFFRRQDMQHLYRLWHDEEGQDIAEYAVMLAVILVIVVGTIRLIGSNANNVFSNVASSIQ